MTFGGWLLNEEFDRETTEVSRAVVEAIKTNWKYVGKYNVNLGAGNSAIEFIKQVPGEAIPVSMQREYVKFVREGNPVKQLAVLVKSHDGPLTEKGTHVQGAWDGNKKLLVLTVRIGTSANFLNDLIVNLKSTIRHELEHFRQDNSGRDFPADIPLSRDGNYKDPVKYLSYLTHPREVEANVVGIAKRAKMGKVSFADALAEWLHRKVRLRMSEIGHKEEDVERIISSTRLVYLDEFKKRYGGHDATKPFSKI